MMKMMYPELLSLLPGALRQEAAARQRETLWEIRLREGAPMTFITADGFRRGQTRVTGEDLRFAVNAASHYSPWNAESVARGYLTAPGGHRIGLCGVVRGEKLQELTGLCIRVARDCVGVARGIPVDASLLILGPPGSGKTTLLRDLVRRLSEGSCVSVVDEREELFPRSGGEPCFDPGPNTDVLLGCEKARGIERMLKVMGPGWIVTDEITGEGDCAALVRALYCGVKLAATVHADGIEDLRKRAVCRPLVETGAFRRAVVLTGRGKWHMEELGQ